MGGEEVRKCRECNDHLKPFGLRYAVWRLFCCSGSSLLRGREVFLYSTIILTMYVTPRTLWVLKDDGV